MPAAHRGDRAGVGCQRAHLGVRGTVRCQRVHLRVRGGVGCQRRNWAFVEGSDASGKSYPCGSTSYGYALGRAAGHLKERKSGLALG